MYTILNIGMTNNPFSRLKTLKKVSAYFQDAPIDFIFSKSSYKGKKETVLIAVYDDTLKDTQISKLCDELKQECIAIKRNDKGSLIYATQWNKEKMEFNEMYFKTI
jgi:hypothetical protein